MSDIPTLSGDQMYEVLLAELRRYGLGDIYDRVREFIASDASGAEVEIALRDAERFPEVQERFSAVFEAEREGRAPISFEDVLNHEAAIESLFSYYDYELPAGESVQSMAAAQLNGQTSVREIEERLVMKQAFGRQVLDDPNLDPDVLNELLTRGMTPMDAAEFFLDPEATLAQLERRTTAAMIANEANQANYRVSADEVLELSRAGVTAAQAQQSFGALTENRQVVDALVGEASDPVSREQELAAITGDAQAQGVIQRSAERRTAAFTQGGDFATDEEGFGGLR